MRIRDDLKSIWTAAVILLALSCGESDAPTSDGNLSRTPSGPKEVTVRVGETVEVNNLEITFIGVLEDSRCPVDVTCIWEGNAKVELAVGVVNSDAPTIQLVLNTATEPRYGDTYGQRITLRSVRPDPVSNTPIPPDTYEVHLKVEPLAPGREGGVGLSR